MDDFRLIWDYRMPPQQGGGTATAPMRVAWQGCGSPAAPCPDSAPSSGAQIARAAASMGSLGLADDVRDSRVAIAVTGLFLASTGAAAYHGYERSRGSVGAALGWAALGFLFPIITIPIALAQGFGKPK